MAVRRATLEGLLVIERPTIGDERGFFRESFRMNELDEVRGEPTFFVQENHSRSRQGVLRGLHPENWDKLVYVPRGEVFTALADVRLESPTFGQIETFVLGETNRWKLFIPRGLAHGFCVLSDEADYVYQVTAYYDGSDTRAVAWNDPDLAVPWPVQNPTISERDRKAPTMRQLFPERYR
jgi:dTDP-4-dehydrorhamnose 3,5-epimerase